jgi:hypothetical protein
MILLLSNCARAVADKAILCTVKREKCIVTSGSSAIILWLSGSRTVLDDGVRMPMRTRFDILFLLTSCVRWVGMIRKKGVQMGSPYSFSHMVSSVMYKSQVERSSASLRHQVPRFVITKITLYFRSLSGIGNIRKWTKLSDEIGTDAASSKACGSSRAEHSDLRCTFHGVGQIHHARIGK